MRMIYNLSLNIISYNTHVLWPSINRFNFNAPTQYRPYGDYPALLVEEDLSIIDTFVEQPKSRKLDTVVSLLFL
jgi:hypothetical protein